MMTTPRYIFLCFEILISERFGKAYPRVTAFGVCLGNGRVKNGPGDIALLSLDGAKKAGFLGTGLRSRGGRSKRGMSRGFWEERYECGFGVGGMRKVERCSLQQDRVLRWLIP